MKVKITSFITYHKPISKKRIGVEKYIIPVEKKFYTF